MLRRGIGLLICVFGALSLSLPLYASAHVAGLGPSGAPTCESLINWKSVQFPTAPPVPGGQDVTVQGGPYRLYARAYASKSVGTHPVLVVVLHGDGPPPYQFPNYQYAFAAKVAAENENVVAVGLLRPGYTDPQGHHSQGCSGQRDGDNWDAQDTGSIADAIADLKRRYKARDVIVAGHSGGAAIAANILGRRPQLIDAALLVSCPCGDVNRWRSEMLKHTGFSVFKGNIQSLSPIDQVLNINPKVPIVMMTGTEDHVAPLAVAERYRAAAAKAGEDVTLIKLPGRPHNTFLYPKVFAELGDIIRRVQGLDVQRTAAAKASRTGPCPIGIYQLSDGSKLDVGQSRGDHLRWSKEDGTTGLLSKGENGTWTSTLGWTGRPDGKRVSFDCDKDTIDFAGITGKQIPLDVTNVTFQGAGVQLAGRLVLPQGTGRVPIVILVHGSEHDSALKFYSLQRQLPADGIGVFVYDKRGTGNSGGTYTQNYLLLADDAIAAMNEAKRLAGTRAGRIGYQGGSQAGWVAPLAARIAPVDFVIVGYGLAVSPLDEVREATAFDLTSRGYGPDVVAKAMHIADAVSAVIVSDFRSGYDQLAAVKAKYGKEPWFKYVRGDVAFYLLETPEAKLREEGPVLLAGVPANYDPMPVLRNLDTPQLWILAADDHDAPSAETARRLRALQAKGKPITVAVFPHTEHGIYEFETKPDGTRVNTRNPQGYFAMLRDFILHGRLGTHRYGDSTIQRPPAVPVAAGERN